MRNRFVKCLMDKVDSQGADRVAVLTGDLGFSVLEPLRERLGAQFINVGVSEALMATMAAGIASQGFKTFIYSITPFVTFRCLEQIRNDICYHNMDVTVVGVGAGYGYGSLGPTHHALEDLAALWAIPNMKVYCPADLIQTDWAFETNWNSVGPSYLRIGKGGEGTIPQTFRDCGLGIMEYGTGADLTVITTGSITQEVLRMMSQFNRELDIQVLSLVQLKPFPEAELIRLIKSHKICVVEELSPYGGLSGAVSKALLQAGFRVDKFFALSAPDEFAQHVGDMNYQRTISGLDASRMAQFVREKLL